MRLSVPVHESEVNTICALKELGCPYLFSVGLVVWREGRLAWRVSAGTKLLNTIEGLESFRTAGSGAQTLYGKVLRVQSSAVN